MAAKTKLELTWLGKDSRPRLEPRILIEEPEFSYHAKARRDGDVFDNMLIHGDNLLALKALEDSYKESVQAIYIDPPFNTGEAFEHYDDGVEHSLWLSLMRDRIEILHKLLKPSGTFFVHIDDNELAYLIAVSDEIFGRKNRIAVLSFKQSSVSGPKARNPGVISIGSYLIIYAKNKSLWKNFNTYRATERDSRYSQFIENFEENFANWRFVPLSSGIEKLSGKPFKQWEREVGKNFEREMEKFVIENRHRVVQIVSVADKDVNAEARVALQKSRSSGVVEKSPRKDLEDYYFFNGKQVAFYKSKVRKIDGALTTAERVSNIWDDLLSNNVHKEGGVRLPNGKKPEALLRRCLMMSTEPGDLVLDSFLGSGTTCAVAHKMRRRWIGIELRDHAKTHCVPRLAAIIDGEDQSGITSAVNWQGGGGFRFLRLAPSLLEKDAWGNWVIRKDYNAAMLAEAMCKHFNYTYAPSTAHFWMHGHSSETSYIYVTTNSLNGGQLRMLSNEVGEHRSLLICCKAFEEQGARALNNLTIRKIPGAVLDRCEWGKDDYSLKIESLPIIQEDVEDDLPLAPNRNGKRGAATGDLFAEDTVEG